jgi:hypothetical protein
MAETRNERGNRILAELEQFNGTENYYKYLSGLKLTDGVKYLAEKAGAYWLMDIIAGYQSKLKDQPFQIWRIHLKEGNTADVSCRPDSDQPAIVTQHIPYTDFPIHEYELYCIDGVILLKGEY